MKSNYQLVAEMHKKFGLYEPEAGPRVLTKEEVVFRITAMHEELLEYMATVFNVEMPIDTIQSNFTRMLNTYELNPNPDLSEQFDALLDLAVFVIGTADRQNLPWENGFERVMQANIAKELGANGEKRGGFKRDLVKPGGWKAPILDDLIMDQARVAAGVHHSNHVANNISSDALCGLIILDGPDCAGKSTLANAIAEQHDGVVVHRTWSPTLENTMDQYLMDPVNMYRKGDLLIIDRNALSEWIYSSVYREGTKWKGFHRLALEKLEKLNALHIICVPDSKLEWAKNVAGEVEDGRKEMYPIGRQMCEVYNFYKDIVSTDGDLSCISPGLKLKNYFHYDMQSTDVEEFAKSTVPLLLKGANANV